MSKLVETEAWKEKLTPGEKLVLVALADQCNDDGECFILIGTLTNKCSMKDRAVQDNLKRLIARRLVEREERPGRSSIFYLYPGKYFSNPRRFCTTTTPAESAPTPADSAPTPAESAPTPAESAPTPADSAPITVSYPVSNHNLTVTYPNARENRLPEKPQAAKVKRQAAMLDNLPDCIPESLYLDIVDHRKSMKCPVTQQAMRVVVQQLADQHADGQDIRAMLNQSISNGWKGLFPVRKDNSAPYATHNHPPAFERFTAEEGVSNVSRF